MARSMEIRFDTRSLRAFAAQMGVVGEQAFDRSQRKAVTFIAKDYRAWKTQRIRTDIDRPTAFTRRAYDYDGAKRTGSEIFSRAFVRPTQSRYLLMTETGGTRRFNGRSGPMAPKPGTTDRFGGLHGPGGLQRRFMSRSATAPYRTGSRVYSVLELRDRRTGKILKGVFEKRKMGKRTTQQRRRHGKSSWRTRLLVSFMPTARYRPTLHFVRDARRYANTRFARMSVRLFNDEVRRIMRRPSGR